MHHASKHLHVLIVKRRNNKDTILRSSGNFLENSGRLKKLGDWVQQLHCLLSFSFTRVLLAIYLHSPSDPFNPEEKVKGRATGEWAGWPYVPPQPNYIRS